MHLLNVKGPLTVVSGCKGIAVLIVLVWHLPNAEVAIPIEQDVQARFRDRDVTWRRSNQG